MRTGSSPSDEALDCVLERLRDMLVRDSDSLFRVQYRQALQHSPDAVMAHAPAARRIPGRAIAAPA